MNVKSVAPVKNTSFLYTGLVCLILLFASSCRPDDDVKKVDKSQIISFVTDAPTNLVANGKDSYSLRLQVPANASNAFQLVTIRCSDGKFDGENKDPKETQKRIEVDGQVNATWIVPEKGGDYYITASIGSDSDIYKIEQKIHVNDVNKTISLIVDASDLASKNLTETTIEANGKSIIKFVAKISVNLPVSLQTITFKCSTGKFDGEGEPTSRPVKINAQGEASIYWIVPSQPGASYISASTGSGTDLEKAEKQLNLLEAKPSFRLRNVTAGTVLADGYTVLTYQIDKVNNIPSNKLVIAQNKGVLIDGAGSTIKDGTLKLVNGEGTFYVRVDQTVEDYYVKVQTEAGDFYVNDKFTPERAYGEEVYNLPSKLVIGKDDTDIDITASLTRSVGKVSIGTPIYFEAYQEEVAGVKKAVGGLFKDASKAFTDANGSFTVKYVLDRTKINTSLPLVVSVTSLKNSIDRLPPVPVRITFN